MVAYDSSGNGNDGNLTNGPAWTTGKIGGALSFDGVDDRVKIPNILLDGKNLLTISLWFMMNTSSTNTTTHDFISGAKPGENNEIRLFVHNTNGIGIADGGSITYSLIESLDYWSNDWRHLTFVRNYDGISFYLNANYTHLFPFSPTPLSISPNGLWIGADQDTIGGGWDSGESLQGKLDDYRIYDRALSAAEVQALYNLGQ